MTEISYSESHKWIRLAEREYLLCQKKILGLVKNFSAERYLDIGCAGGDFARQCGEAAGATELHGIEIDTHFCAEAGKHGIEVVNMDASDKFPYPEEYFNLITANQVLEHVRDTDSLIQESYRVLRKNGLLVLSSPNLCSLLQRVLVVTGNQPTTLHVSKVQVGNFIRGTETKAEHIHAFSPGALEDLLRYHGFRIVSSCGSGFYPLNPSLSKMASNLFPRLAVYYIVAGTK
jgi:ubiquinone/menaquinone biosynthesis C-methylase UbiE